MTVKFSLLAAGHCMNHENLSIAGGRRIAIKFPALVGLIEHPKIGPVLFDTGYASHFFDETRSNLGSVYARITPVTFTPEQGIARQLEHRGIRASDVSVVILSHFHADHVAGAKDFPNASFVCYEQAYRQLRAMGPLRALTHAFLPGLLPKDFESRTTALEQGRQVELSERFRPFVTGVDLFGDRSVVAVDLPGHALGHFGILLDTEPKPHFLVGDACWHSESVRENRMPHWLPQRLVFSDRHQYRSTLVDLHTLHQANADLVIVPSHCQEMYEKILGEAASAP
jgi:glyoxylase-like metal-dependent hydrolase (beta-lactamase superfamily II)